MGTGNEPRVVVDSGDTVVVWTRDVSDNQIAPDSDTSVIAGLDWDRVVPAAGPIGVHGAEPGDTLAIEILDIHTQGWGWTGGAPRARAPARGLPGRLPADLRLTNGEVAYMRDDIAIPLSRSSGRWASARPARARSR